MCVVVLHPDKGELFALRTILGIAGGEIVRMEVAHQSLRPNTKQFLKVGDLIFVVGQSGDVFQVSDVLGRENLIPSGQAEGGLLLRTAGQNGAHGPVEDQRLGSVAPGAAKGVVFPPEHPQQRIVTAGGDVTVMNQKSVRNAPQAAHRFLVVNEDGIVGQVGAGHHQRGEVLHQQVVEGGVGQHEAQIVVVADPLGDSGFFAQQHDGPPPGGEESFLLGIDLTQRSCRSHIAAHESERLFVPLLALTEGVNNIGLGQAGQMEAAQTFDGNDFAVFECGFCLLQSIAGAGRTIPGQIGEGGAAVGAAGGLSVIAAVFDVVVLRLAIPAHGEFAHGGEGAVVGHVPDDGEPGAAVGAVEEGVAVAAVGGVVQLPQTVGAGAHVGADQRLPPGKGFAFQNGETLITRQFRQVGALNPGDDGQRGLFRGEGREKLLQPVGLALQLQFHTARGVAHPAG